MDRNLASILALAGTAAITVTLAAVSPADAYAGDMSMHDGDRAPSSLIEELKSLYPPSMATSTSCSRGREATR